MHDAVFDPDDLPARIAVLEEVVIQLAAALRRAGIDLPPALADVLDLCELAALTREMERRGIPIPPPP